MNRRQVLALAAGGSLTATAGCLDIAPTTTEDHELKPDSWDDHCPGAGPLDVDWPEELDRSTVRSFVHDYEFRYMRDVFHEFDPFLEDRYDTDIDVTDVSRVGDGYEASVSTRASTIHGTLTVIATEADDIEAEQVIPVEEIPADRMWIGDSVSEALASESQPAGETSPAREVAEQFAELSTEFDDPEAIIDHPIYVDVDGTVYELNFEYDSSGGLIGDMWRDVEYYVDGTGLVMEWEGEETVIQCREV